MFTDPPLVYFVYKGEVFTVENPNSNICGQRSVAGYRASLWDDVKVDKLPLNVRHGSPEGYFYQVHHSSDEALRQMIECLKDATGAKPMPLQMPRHRIVVFARFPNALSGDHRRFARKNKRPPAIAEVPMTVAQR